MPLNILNGKTCDREILLALVNDCKTQLQLLQNERENLFPPNLPLHPVPFFGNPFQAEVLTVALNPSFTEFNPGRGWEEELEIGKLIGRLQTYFENDPQQWHVWFNQPEKALSYFGSSYETNTAHVDLFPYPTLRPSDFGNDLQKRSDLAQLVLQNPSHLQHVLQLCRSVKLLIVIEYPFVFSRDPHQKLSVFEVLQQYVPKVAGHIKDNGNTFPVVRFVGPNEVGDWAFHKRRSIRKYLREAAPIEF